MFQFWAMINDQFGKSTRFIPHIMIINFQSINLTSNRLICGNLRSEKRSAPHVATSRCILAPHPAHRSLFLRFRIRVASLIQPEGGRIEVDAFPVKEPPEFETRRFAVLMSAPHAAEVRC
jgi:hypothetical protein